MYIIEKQAQKDNYRISMLQNPKNSSLGLRMIFLAYLKLLLLQFLSIRGMGISEICVCGHVQSENDCKNSGFCIWQNDACILKFGQTYNKIGQDSNSCKNYAKEDCREQKQCGFYLGQCNTFQDCSVFNKDHCEESSYRCVSDSKKCIERQECNNYKTLYECANKNQNGKYCFWVQEVERKCRDAIICEELPIYLTSHIMCKEALQGCTVNEKGYGCIKQMDSCTQYYNDFQCIESKSESENCFWDLKNSKCVSKVCENLPFSQDYECKSYLSQCTSNGIHCIKRRQCIDAQNKFGCVTDAEGNKCEFHKNQCKIKTCDTALDYYTNYQQCQGYDNFLDCVTAENGGCKQRPQKCDGYGAEVDCYSIEEQDCIWYNNKCEKRQCQHAPVFYNLDDCMQYGNCIGKIGGGCQETPQICDQIFEEQFCKFNYNKDKCIWLDNECTLLECNKLKLPTFFNHQICQKASSYCTFNLEQFGCVDYVCENIVETELCSIDSNGTVCTLNQGCIDKKCQTAPPTYVSNEQCEEWLPYCTVNVQVLQQEKILIGCVNKYNDCLSALEEQCQSTFSGINCKWDSVGQKCLYKVCTDADPNQYLNNEDCKQFKVISGTCIIGSSNFGCQQWPNNCYQLISQLQCQLNLQDGTKCFWTGSSQCTDASIINYTNNIECNSWLDYCIYNSISGGCMNRPASNDCTLSPNDNMYDTHQECIAWDPKCTVVSTFNAEGCEQKKTNCFEFIRQRNCKTTLSGQNCYWDDKEQKCKDEYDDNDCNKRIYGDLSHQDCEKFLSKCTVRKIQTSCKSLSKYCDYLLEQQCVITIFQQPCKWDLKNQRCKDVECYENITAETEAECLNFRKQNQCQLKIQTDQTYGPGCESRPFYCEQITNHIKCKLTLTLQNQRCYYFDFKCQVVQSNQCEVIQDSKSNEVCQLYNPQCILQPSGQGCYSIFGCSDLSNNVCNNAIMKFNNKCKYSDTCRLDDYCYNKYASLSTCQDKKTQLGQLCYYRTYCYYGCSRYCEQKTGKKYLQFELSTSFSDKSKLCQEYSSNYKYDTNCNCCVIMTSCTQQQGGQQLCNSSTSNNKCGYNFQTNTCETRKCEHLTYVNYAVISDQICYDWKYNCVLDATGCTNYTGDCTSIKLIYQCYQQQCFWQDGKCVNHVDCQVNTTAVLNRECLLVNAENCRLNYTQGFGCSFFDCSMIKNLMICNSTKLVDGQSCNWINGLCKSKICSNFTIQSDCESSYEQYSIVTTKCFWCIYNTTKCSNQQYCSLSSMILPKSHQDCNSQNFQHTIDISMSSKCTIKKQLCSEYIYEDACVSTIDGVECQWNSNICINICQAAIFNPFSTNLQCFNWHSDCMSSTGSQCELLDCSNLAIIEDCTIYTKKCFWDGSICQTIGACNNYFTNELCLNTKSSKGIPCFWNNTQCIEKTCQNKPTPSSSNLDCDSWLKNCQFNINTNQCVEDCTSADISYITHNQCDSYYDNKSCTVKLDIIQCVYLPVSCNLAKKTQCYIDRVGNQCYFDLTSNKCIILTCTNLSASFITHKSCNEKKQDCTVNTTLNGCQQLNDCSSYLIQEQCQIDSNKTECEWILSQNKCIDNYHQITECSTAQLITFSAFSCHQYFGDTCTVNSNLDGCNIGQLSCKDYTYQQCISSGQMNLKRVSCFWNEEKNNCQEKICENAPSNAQTHSECSIFLSTCQKGGCRIKGCFDYNYAIDSACASIFEDKRCTTNGYQCILRMACEDVKMIDGCTYDIHLNPCVWIDEKCYTKTCSTAQVSLNKYEECNAYLPYCTVKQEGGCTRKQSCSDYYIKEACQTDSENQECIWDNSVKKCFSNQCIGYCGDGIVSNKDEQCDDGNYLPYDGCYKCLVQCPIGCNICNGQQCKECQKIGWYLIESVCTSKCGDGHAVDNEQCDDGNNIQFDGCYECSYSCHEKCLNCFQGQCLECEKGFLENGPFCHHICGDGYVVNQLEQCDDGNLNNHDGCNNTCQVEQNWKCQTDNFISFCYYVILPKITLTKLSKKDVNIQEIKLSFSEPVRLNEKAISEEQFLQLIVIEIINAKNNQYDFETKPMIPINTELADVAYKIIVYFKTNVKNPVLKVAVNSDNIVNLQENSLFSKEAKLELKSSYKISTDQQSLMFKTSMFSRIVLYLIFVTSGISCLFGNLEILWNLLDMLQQLSYMKFHNLQFPDNLQDYFEIFSIGSFTPIIDKLQIDLYLQNIFNFQAPVIKAKWKFEYYQINCYFLQTFETLLIMILLGFTYFILSYLLYKLLIFSKYNNWPAIFQQDHPNSSFKVVKFIFSIQRYARKYYQYFIYSGLIRIFTSNFYELTFAAILQLVNIDTKTTLNTIIFFLALITLIFNITLLINFFIYLSYKTKVAKTLKVLVEGIKNKENQGQKQYFTILLIKKTLFITNLVLFQGLAGAQSIITACLSGIFSYYVFLQKPFENNFENIKIYITEILIMLNVIIFSLYEMLNLNQDQESAQVLGWINIGGFTLILILTLAIDIYQQLLKCLKLLKGKSCFRINRKKQLKSRILFF